MSGQAIAFLVLNLLETPCYTLLYENLGERQNDIRSISVVFLFRNKMSQFKLIKNIILTYPHTCKKHSKPSTNEYSSTPHTEEHSTWDISRRPRQLRGILRRPLPFRLSHLRGTPTDSAVAHCLVWRDILKASLPCAISSSTNHPSALYVTLERRRNLKST